ncbi:hypothetical protein GCM10025865_32790 [Paraoerskovia sediminicola]|uniref:CopG-like ribbon-helix-helix domain-containing protein n=1 Tax=Paraoerskovia sediminicola TaxID=1138587 RepID=A0ABM8FY94_9CELL|nr:YlcI/YnfO family protein [Paraoerskovia sediminicola]BDZ40711.1 hypothetical protein GCM10025865_00100 [Paraoerskovia sediminicola]BDZ43980.1 hypothetical protein GCM10025865_32790 [Paraoerskovia sediminicola]
MRTTLHLPDDLYRDVKRTAAQEGRTVTSLVEDALREELRRRTAAPGRPYVVPTVDLGDPLVEIDMTSNAAMLDAMDGR